MQVLSTKSEFREHLETVRALGRTVGLVPTMGALHEGHLSLLRAAANDCDVVALTIFVNPLQFGAGEDLDAYPRPLEHDLELAEAAGADVVFTPTTSEMYPEPTLTNVHVDRLTSSMEGASRPTHFDGVSTVVTKLFNIAGPCRAYFGEKDFQQLAVVRRMAADLDQSVEIVGCPIVRETDGLAMSSRNVYLSSTEREAATVINRALRAGAAMIEAGESDPSVIEAHMASIINAEPLAALDYAVVVDPESLLTPDRLASGTTVRLLMVAQVGTPRLLDNLGVDVP
ncbi:MAG: pantoate--beta-alanine ligase [Actinobacteria bacterium]|uniref:pantoate--beta-alanine ligase (AMP-forming) n=2 Tax=freshwater metagenome TaxID=449393 RepID=A0A6J6P5E8_9ZZZZ|nr:pantoate--beta-alanine ligase [Actinomycetota bacterium]MSX34114.1 pantoate--beta-alanine ligase [Actinomycetota bacterium]MSX96461.1 pantoate--beta-alanine ligase [Actinomycetota bacterium]MSY24348.1 pantoate--beta-alanine ligase [Actinomycetota bacterium]MSZ51219.1 pantoate--beta-alanine ligase [Actinomycetota bacterium]